MERRLSMWFPARGHAECASLASELIRLARSSGSTVTNSELEQDLSRSEIIRQLEVIVGIAPQVRSPWRLEVAQSSAAGGDDGVMLHGSCEASSVLAVYPGVSYTTTDLPGMAKKVLKGNHYMLFLRNGVIIDGRPDGRSRKVFEAAWQRAQRTGGCVDYGRLGVGHLVNHPPRGVKPNVHVVPLDLGPDEHTELHRHLPVVPPRQPLDGEPWKRTAVLVASRALRDEELWLDYKLRADAHRLPAWYEPCEPLQPAPGMQCLHDPRHDGAHHSPVTERACHAQPLDAPR